MMHFGFASTQPVPIVFVPFRIVYGLREMLLQVMQLRLCKWSANVMFLFKLVHV